VPRRNEKTFGNWFHDELVTAYALERETWAIEQARRIEWKLNRARRGKPKLGIEVLWLNRMGAFTAPGKWIYISRRLLERCSSDAPAALAIAHEMAHHDLGHLEAASTWVSRLPRVGWARMMGAFFRLLEARWISRENELAADLRGWEVSVRAGYGARDALTLFDVLAQHALDYGDVDGVYGPDEPDSADDVAERLILKARSWWASHLQTHPPLADRKAALEARTQGQKRKTRTINEGRPGRQKD
jgi:Zn-dependent protease with chaperone function